MPRDANGNFEHVSYSQLAKQLTEMWHTRAHARWSAVVGYVEVADQMTFYSVDHPLPFVPNEKVGSGLLSFEETKRAGYIGICDPADARFEACETWMKENAAGAERVVISTRRFFQGQSGISSRWHVYFVPPAGAK